MVISIITATFNSGATLRSTLESVLAQTCQDFEYIIVDGNSQDNTMDIVREYEPRFAGRMKWISEPDNGIYDAMNKGIRMASGDIVGLLNSDDFYTSAHVLQQIVDAFSETDAVYGDVHYIDGARPEKCIRYYSSKGFKRWMMRLGFMPAHPSFYCRRAIYTKFGLFDTDFRIAADFEQLFRLIYVNRIRTKYIPMDFVTMRTGGASSSGMQSHKQILRDHMLAYRKNGYRGNYLLEGLSYLYKIGELLLSKIRH